MAVQLLKVSKRLGISLKVRRIERDRLYKLPILPCPSRKTRIWPCPLISAHKTTACSPFDRYAQYIERG
jgi:hypothetical protein